MVVELNGKKHDVPTCLEELKTRYFCRIFSEWDIDKPPLERDFFKLFCILSDTNFKGFQPSVYNESAIWNIVSWIENQPFNFSKKVPKVLKVQDKILVIPKRIEMQSIGQNILLKQSVAGMKYPEAGISIAVALFLQPQWDGGKPDYDKALELKAIIDEMPAYLIYPIGFFLLRNALSYGQNLPTRWRHTKTSRIKKMLRRLRGWLMSKGLNLIPTFQSWVNMRSGSRKTRMMYS